MRDLHARMLDAVLGGESLQGVADLAAVEAGGPVAIVLPARGLSASSTGAVAEELAGSDLVRQALGDHIFERYVELKREEWEEYRVQVTQWELEKYLPVL